MEHRKTFANSILHIGKRSVLWANYGNCFPCWIVRRLGTAWCHMWLPGCEPGPLSQQNTQMFRHYRTSPWKTSMFAFFRPTATNFCINTGSNIHHLKTSPLVCIDRRHDDKHLLRHHQYGGKALLIFTRIFANYPIIYAAQHFRPQFNILWKSKRGLLNERVAPSGRAAAGKKRRGGPLSRFWQFYFNQGNKCGVNRQLLAQTYR